jgi:hypothetical protein
MASSKHISIREAALSDIAFIIACFDTALPYLASIGCYETKPSGAIVLTTTGHQAPQSVSPSVTEVFVKFFITDRRLRVKSKGVGARLLDFAKEVTRREQIKLLRVDCWSGGNGSLIGYVALRVLVAIMEITLALDITKVKASYGTNSSSIQINIIRVVTGPAGCLSCGCRNQIH